jgi:hypothetical protein
MAKRKNRKVDKDKDKKRAKEKLQRAIIGTLMAIIMISSVIALILQL